MDGIEWSRARWGLVKQAILYVNERIACWVGDAAHRRPPRDRDATCARKARRVEDHDDHLRRPRGRRRPRPRRSTALGLDAGPLPHADLPPDPGELDPRARAGLLGPPARRARSRPRRLHARDRRLPPRGRRRGERRGRLPRVRSTSPRSVAALRFHGLGYLHGHTVGRHEPVARRGDGRRQPRDRPRQRRTTAGSPATARSTSATPTRPAERIDALLDDAEPRGRSVGCRRAARHAEEFTWEHVAGQYEAAAGIQLGRRRVAPTQNQRGARMIRVGVVGLGKMGLSHLAMIHAHPDVERRRGRRLDRLRARRALQVHRAGDLRRPRRRARRGRARRRHHRDPDPPARARWCARRSSAGSTCSARSR